MARIKHTPDDLAFDYKFMCPACNKWHYVNVGNDSIGRHTFNGNLERPTLTPEIRLSRPSPRGYFLCIATVTDGQIAFSEHATHELAGETVDLPDLINTTP